MALSCQLFVAIMALLTLRCFAHWRLTKPVPRSGGAYENNPLSPDANTKEEWVCRNASPNPNVERPTFEAGKPTGIVYGTGAIGHVGDCAVYISYDTTWPRRMMRWVKIANLPDCRKQINQLVEIVVPSVLPAGDAVFRWDQAALHQIHNTDPFVEWFIQCADIAISSSSARSWDSFNSFSMIDNNGTPAYPSSVSSYRRNNLASVNDADFWMTGPACVDDSVNQCWLTAVGTQGYTGFGGESGGTVASSPSPAAGYGPTPTSTTSVRYSTSTSNARSSMSENDAMCCYDPSCSTYGTSFCNPVGSWCSGSVDTCRTCGGTLCVESSGGGPIQVHSEQQSETEAKPEPEPEPGQDAEPQPDTEAEAEPELEPEPEAEPEPEPEQMTGVTALAPSYSSPSSAGAECCFYGGCSSYGTSFCYAEGLWCAGSARACASCGGAWCTDVTLLSTEHGRQRKFLRRRSFSGNALVQTNASFQKAETTYLTFDADEL